MRFLRSIKDVFSPEIKLLPEVEELDDKDIVMRLSMGNIRLQEGAYVTSEEAAKLREEVSKLSFR